MMNQLNLKKSPGFTLIEPQGETAVKTGQLAVSE